MSVDADLLVGSKAQGITQPAALHVAEAASCSKHRAGLESPAILLSIEQVLAVTAGIVPEKNTRRQLEGTHIRNNLFDFPDMTRGWSKSEQMVPVLVQ
jgi:hypothetical protein